MKRRRAPLSYASDQTELDMASQIADSTAARIDETLERAPAGAIHEQMVGDMSYAEGVRDALAWATGLNPAADRLVRLLDLHTEARHASAKCGRCGVSIQRRDLTPEQATWRGGQRVIWVDPYGSAKSTWTDGHYHDPHLQP